MLYPRLLALLSAATLLPAQPPPVTLTAQEDHQRLLKLLGVSSLRRGADGRNAQAPNAANYDESKATPYPDLPDPLRLNNGRRVTKAADWWKKRRPEIVELFDREVYGRMPKQTPAVRWEVAGATEETVGGIPVVVKKLTGHVDNSAYPLVTVDIQLTLTTPAKAAQKVPVVMELSFNFRPGAPRPPTGEPLRAGAASQGPEAPRAGAASQGPEAPRAVAASAARLAPPANAAPPPVPVGPTSREQALAKGWGYATLIPTSVQPDNGGGLTQGIIGLVNKGQPRGLEDWGALRAWAWGASRALDYFETDKAVDAKRVAIEGHSRYGKAAAVAMADDSRFAVAFLSSSGAGGVKIHRRNWGEMVENVAAPNEYHWMAGNYLKYAGPLQWKELPVDAHELIALCAPRPVFISAGATNGDGWVDAKGMFLAGVGAGPVYRLLGKKDLGVTEFPPIETGLMDGEVSFRQHSAGHTPGPNWPVFLTYAERYFALPARRGQ